MSDDSIRVQPIGVIRSPHRDPAATPIQPVFATGIAGTVEVDRAYAAGLQDLEGFSHIYLLYHFDRAPATKLVVRPYLQDEDHGVFATRAPGRPNALGLSIVRLERRAGCILHVLDIDVLDGTPLLDIKPYVPRFDIRRAAHSGWQARVDEETAARRGRRDVAPSG